MNLVAVSIDRSAAQAAQAECSRLLVDFVNALDCNDSSRALELFVCDALLETPGRVMRGTREIDTFLHQRPRQRITRHICTNQAVDMLSSERATGIAYVLFFQAPNESGAALPLPLPTPALAEYRASFTRDEDQWRIQTLRIGMVFTD